MNREKKVSGVYILQCLANNKAYVGSTSNLAIRKRKHFYELRKGIHQCKDLLEDFNKFGQESFEFKLLEQTEDLLARESFWIEKYKALEFNHGYNKEQPVKEIKHTPDPELHNIRKPGTGRIIDYTTPVKSVEEAVERKVSAANPIYEINALSGEVTWYPNPFNYRATKGFKDYRVRQVLDYWDPTKDERKARSHKGYILVRATYYDPSFDYLSFHKKAAPKEKKIRNRRKENPIDRRRPIIAVNLSTNVSKEYSSIKDCVNEGNFSRSKVDSVLRGATKQHKGFYFSYINQELKAAA